MLLALLPATALASKHSYLSSVMVEEPAEGKKPAATAASNNKMAKASKASALDHFDTLDGRKVSNVNAGNGYSKTYLNITRVVYDLYRPYGCSLAGLDNVKEFWLSPKCDIAGILQTIGRSQHTDSRGNFSSWDCTIFIPDTLYPNGPSYGGSIPPGCRVMLYSGSDVYAAAKAGKAAARDWCTSHSYTARISTTDRLYSWPPARATSGSTTPAPSAAIVRTTPSTPSITAATTKLTAKRTTACTQRTPIPIG